MSTQLQEAFTEIGARLADDKLGRIFEIDIVTQDDGEAYQLQRPVSDALTIEVMDVKPRKHHLGRPPVGHLAIAGRPPGQDTPGKE